MSKSGDDNLQKKFDVAFGDDDLEIDDLPLETDVTDPTIQSDELELSDDLDLEETNLDEVPEAPAAADEVIEDLDLDLSLDDDGPPHTPTETKIKAGQDLSLDLELSTNDESDDLPQLPSSSDDLEAELLDEASDNSFHLTESMEAPTPKKKSSSNTQVASEVNFEDDEPLSADQILDSLEKNESSLNVIKNEDSVKFYKGDDNPLEKIKKQSTAFDETEINSGISGGGEGLVRLQTTLRHLRAEREQLLKDFTTLKTEKKFLEQDNLGFKAEIDELKIELSIVKKRNSDELAELRYQLRVSEEKKSLFEEKAKGFQKEFDRMNQKVRIDINQVKQREKELEGKLELMAMDSATQIQSRDHKILELKRKIDALEFNMENISIQEQKAKDDKYKVEERLMKIVKTLRGSIKLLEDDIDLNEDFLDEIKKM